jgi:hypothetical protein
MRDCNGWITHLGDTKRTDEVDPEIGVYRKLVEVPIEGFDPVVGLLEHANEFDTLVFLDDLLFVGAVETRDRAIFFENSYLVTVLLKVMREVHEIAVATAIDHPVLGKFPWRVNIFEMVLAQLTGGLGVGFVY